MAASYGAEDKVVGSTGGLQHPLAGKGVPESSLEIMQNTQAGTRRNGASRRGKRRRLLDPSTAQKSAEGSADPRT